MDDLPAPRWLVRLGTVSWLALGVLGLAAVAVVGLSYFKTIALPVIFAAVAAAVFVPLVDRLQRARVPRGIGALVAIVLIVGLLAGVVTLVTRSVVSQGDELAEAFREALASLQDWLAGFGVDATTIEQAVSSLSSLLSSGGGGGLVSSAASAAAGAASLVIGLFLGAVFLYFLLRDGPTLPDWAARNLSSAQATHATSVARSAVTVIRRYYAGRAVVALFDAVTIGGAAAILRVPLVPAIFVLTFLGGFVPYLGAVVAGTLAVVLALTVGAVPALVMLGVVLLVQNVLEQLVEARVVGQTLGLHPMIVILATTIGGIAAGFAGLVLAAPLTGTLVRVRNEYRRLEQPRSPEAPSPEAPSADAPSPEAPSPDDLGEDEALTGAGAHLRHDQPAGARGEEPEQG
jgi:predicted PurR-regulated permease PerM